MKNKSTLAFCTFFLSSCLFIIIGAQEQKVKNHIFDLEIVNYSNKSHAELEHYHLLKLTNNSKIIIDYELIVKSINCTIEYNNVVKNKKGLVDNENDLLTNQLDSNKNSSLDFKIYDETLSKILSKISLKPKESGKFYLKITRENDSEIGKWKCTKVIAKSLNKNNLKKSVIIKSFIPDSNKKGH